MNLYIEQRMFSWTDRFSVYDITGKVVYTVEGEVFSFGKKLHIYDTSGSEVAFVEQKLFSFLPKYYIYRPGFAQTAEVVREFSFFKQEYSVHPMGWSVRGDFFNHEYQVWAGGLPAATVTKDWFRWGDAYEIEIGVGAEPVLALAVVLIIDACIDAERD